MQVLDIVTKTVTTKFGPKPVFSIVMEDGETYAFGFKKPAFKAGDDIEYTSTEGKYGKEMDATSVRVTSSGKTPAPVTVTSPTAGGKWNPAPAKPFPIPPLHGDRAIIRQNSLTNARETVLSLSDRNVAWGDEEWATRIIAMARMFEAYSAGDLDMEQAVKELGAKSA